MNVVFLGTPEFAVPTLERLVKEEDIGVRAVLCQPDRPAGRSGEPRPPAVKLAALRLRLPVFQPERIQSEEALGFIAQQNAEALVVVAYGQILPPRLLALPRRGALNAHASLLPRYRGAAPIQWAVARGEQVTGMTTMQMDAGLDTGPIWLQREMAIGTDETAPELSARLAAAAAEMVVATLGLMAQGQAQPRPQDGAHATLAPRLTKEDGRIDWRQSAAAIYDRWRGFQPWPGVHGLFRGRPLLLRRCAPAERGAGAPPGTLAVDGEALLCACGSGWLRLAEVQAEGRKAVSDRDFAHGARLRPGEKLE